MVIHKIFLKHKTLYTMSIVKLTNQQLFLLFKKPFAMYRYVDLAYIFINLDWYPYSAVHKIISTRNGCAVKGQTRCSGLDRCLRMTVRRQSFRVNVHRQPQLIVMVVGIVHTARMLRQALTQGDRMLLLPESLENGRVVAQMVLERWMVQVVRMELGTTRWAVSRIQALAERVHHSYLESNISKDIRGHNDQCVRPWLLITQLIKQK